MEQLPKEVLIWLIAMLVTTLGFFFSLVGFFVLKMWNELQKTLDNTNRQVGKAVEAVTDLNSKVGVVIEISARHDAELAKLWEKSDNATKALAELLAKVNINREV